MKERHKCKIKMEGNFQEFLHILVDHKLLPLGKFH